MSQQKLESPYLSFTELLASAFFVFIVMIIYLAINQGSTTSVEGEVVRDIEALERQRYELALSIEKLDLDIDALQEQLRLQVVENESLIASNEKLARQKKSHAAELSKQRAALSELEERQAAAERKQKEERKDILTGVFDYTKLIFEGETNAESAVQAELAKRRQEREQFLSAIGERLTENGLRVDIDKKAYAVAIAGDLVFASNSSRISTRKQRDVVKKVASVLTNSLSCNFPSGSASSCSSNSFKLDTVLIEGHADTKGSRARNWKLSTSRAFSFMQLLFYYSDTLMHARSISEGELSKYPLIGIAGYGEERNRIDRGDRQDEPRNRRIEIRFIFAT
ncbi:MAG: OmpA family protein [Pseudomonadota bacterium]